MKTLSQHPGREVRALEQRMFEDALDPTKSLDHVRPVIIQVPELAVVALVRPPACVSRDAVRTNSKSKRRPRLVEASHDGRRYVTRTGSAVKLDIV